MSEKILLVEGESDKQFFRELLKKISLNHVEIKIYTPLDSGAEKNGKVGACDILSIYMQNLPDGSTSHLAIVMDADYISDGWGFDNTFQKAEEVIKKNGYEKSNKNSYGILFNHPDGLNDVGLWVMPDNRLEGMAEDWIKAVIKSEETSLFEHAINVVGNLPKPLKFKEIHRSKVQVATWMAWQKIPGQGLDAAVTNLIDMKHLTQV